MTNKKSSKEKCDECNNDAIIIMGGGGEEPVGFCIDHSPLKKNKKKSCKCEPLQPFWIRVMSRNLTNCYEGEGSLERPSYICEDNSEEDTFSLTQWFYSTLEKLEKEKKDSPHTIFEISVHSHDSFHYCGDDDKIGDGEKCNKFC